MICVTSNWNLHILYCSCSVELWLACHSVSNACWKADMTSDALRLLWHDRPCLRHSNSSISWDKESVGDRLTVLEMIGLLVSLLGGACCTWSAEPSSGARANCNSYAGGFVKGIQNLLNKIGQLPRIDTPMSMLCKWKHLITAALSTPADWRCRGPLKVR